MPCWRCRDSLILRAFLGYGLNEREADHSSLSRTGRLIDLETHTAVFTWILKRVAEEGLLKGKTLGADATTLETNAAMPSIVNRKSGESYEEFTGSRECRREVERFVGLDGIESFVSRKVNSSMAGLGLLGYRSLASILQKRAMMWLWKSSAWVQSKCPDRVVSLLRRVFGR